MGLVGPRGAARTYTVTVRFKEHEAKASVTVLPDPRSKNTADDWARRWQAIERGGALNDKAVEAALRIRRTRDDVSALEERLRRRNEALRDPAERRKANDSPLAKDAKALKKGLTALEAKLWSPPEEAGIVGPNRIASVLREASGGITSSWAPPSPTHLEELRQAEAKLTAYLAELDAFFAKDVAAFREKAAKEGLGLLAP